jgi:2-polyprenyl-6-methoxyphenol hydroxylase-like FAD-dependent oxidoreductase
VGALERSTAPRTRGADGRRRPFAHFSIGSGTKLALEDAIELARCFGAQGRGHRHRRWSAYQASCAVEVLKIQSAARNSMEWFENVERYTRWKPSSSPTRC